MLADECVFCGLIRTDDARWVVKSPAVRAFPPLDPIAPGHTLVIPTDHHRDILDTPVSLLAEVTETVQRVAKVMRAALGARGIDVLSANGPDSEQSVPHLHLHVVPRWADDGFSTWPAAQSTHALPFDPVDRLVAELAG